MAAEFFYPDAVNATPIAYDEWTLGAGSNKGAACLPGGGRAGPMTHDDDTSYIIKTGTDNGEQELSIDWPTSPIGSITAITAGFRHRWNGASNNSARSIYFMKNAVGGGQVVGVQDSVATYATLGPSDAMSLKPGGGAWTSSDLVAAAPDDIRFYVSQIGADAPDGTRVTSVWGLLTFNPPEGGFVFLLNLAGLSAIPFVGAMAGFGQFSRYLSWRRIHHPRHTILTGAEVQQAWREVREYRHPRFFLPAVA